MTTSIIRRSAWLPVVIAATVPCVLVWAFVTGGPVPTGAARIVSDVFLGIVHRIDKPVSGVLLFARTSKAAERLSQQFREGTIEKIYWAVIEGEITRLRVDAHARPIADDELALTRACFQRLERALGPKDGG